MAGAGGVPGRRPGPPSAPGPWGPDDVHVPRTAAQLHSRIMSAGGGGVRVGSGGGAGAGAAQDVGGTESSVTNSHSDGVGEAERGVKCQMAGWPASHQ